VERITHCGGSSNAGKLLVEYYHHRNKFAGVNVFTTDHPINPEPTAADLKLRRRLVKGFFLLLFSYPVYLLLIGGPLWAMRGHGYFNFVPDRVQMVCFAPTYPIWLIPHVRGRYADYMDWWYRDPNDADRETGWD